MATYLGHCVLNNLFVFHIALITHKQFVDTFGGVAIDFLKPLLHVVERVHVGHIIDDTDTVSATIIRRCDCPETFLARSIPLEYLLVKPSGR